MLGSSLSHFVCVLVNILLHSDIQRGIAKFAAYQFLLWCYAFSSASEVIFVIANCTVLVGILPLLCLCALFPNSSLPSTFCPPVPVTPLFSYFHYFPALLLEFDLTCSAVSLEVFHLLIC